MIIYDKKTDDLIILWEKNQPAVSRDIDGDFWVRETSDGRVIGIEIEDFKKHFVPEHTTGKESK